MKRLAAFAIALLSPLLALGQYNSYTAYSVGTAPSYEGLWWNPSESGWGVSIAHQGDVLFAVWYTYDSDGSPMWLVMPDARLEGDAMGDMMNMMDMSMMGMMRNAPMYTGMLYRPSKVGNRVVMTEVGMGTFLFKDKTHGAFAYTVGNVSQSKTVTRMEFAAGSQECTVGGDAKASAPNYQDLWWNPGDSGWGVNIAHQGDILFATYYTYDASGKGVWYAIPNANPSQAPGYNGAIFRGHGPAFDSAAWDASKVALTQVGQATFGFTSSGATFRYMIDGEGTTKGMSRMAFAAPATTCR